MTSLPWPLVPSRPASPLRGGKRCFTEGECGRFEKGPERNWGEEAVFSFLFFGGEESRVPLKLVLDDHRLLGFILLFLCYLLCRRPSPRFSFASFSVVALLCLQFFVTCSDGIHAAEGGHSFWSLTVCRASHELAGEVVSGRTGKG